MRHAAVFSPHRVILHTLFAATQFFANCLAPQHAHAAAQRSGQIVIASAGQAQVSIVLGERSNETYQFAAAELAKYLKILSGATVQIVSDSEIATTTSQESMLIVGGVAANKAAKETASALQLDFVSLKTDGFLIKSGRMRNRAIVVIAGNDGLSTLYGVYEFIERLGVMFRLTGDILPEPRGQLVVPDLDVRMEPAMSRRGFLVQAGGYENSTIFSYDDYARLIDQMAKMKCNYMQFWWFSYEPWLKFSYKGETAMLGDVSAKESGFMTWTYGGFGSRTTDDVSIGKDRFKFHRLAPPEMQNVETSDQAFQVAEELLHKIIRHANQRGIKVWLAVELDALPPNLARYCEEIGSLPFMNLAGAFVHPLDQTNREIQVSRLKALIDTYPEAEG